MHTSASASEMKAGEAATFGEAVLWDRVKQLESQKAALLATVAELQQALLTPRN